MSQAQLSVLAGGHGRFLEARDTEWADRGLPPFGLGMYATCTIAQTRLQDVVMPYLRYVVVLLITLVFLIVFPALTIWLPRLYGLA